MNLSEFLGRHGLASNPFVAEEAAQDPVLTQSAGACRHPDFGKIFGDPTHPSPAVVFGERGSGKTALRLQMEAEYRDFNRENPRNRVLVIEHNNFDAMIGRIARHERSKNQSAALESVTLSDHIDMVLHVVVPPLVDQLLGSVEQPRLQVSNFRKMLRKAPTLVRREMLLLQIAYDHAPSAPKRSRKLKSALGLGGASGSKAAANWAIVLMVFAAIFGGLGMFQEPRKALLGMAILLAAGAIYMSWTWIRCQSRMGFIARGMHRSVRCISRSTASFRESLHNIEVAIGKATMPTDRGDDSRFAMIDRLLAVLRQADYGSIAILVDRVDEPTAIAGDVDHMRSMVWPLLSSRFLQHRGLAVKLLLPAELGDRFAREDGAFFRAARLDKQNAVERLQWTGNMLARVCDARIRASSSRPSSAVPIENLFDASVGRPRIEEALAGCGNPREACRMIYAMMQEHMAHADSSAKTIPSSIFEMVRQRTLVRGTKR
ncbi:MAG: hypothetical protein K8R92_03980 [Planctomycetes bacterium]|nr:hypothetical protein [Planctomycetota bacterium]